MKKTRKQTILENDLSMPAIMAEFHTYKTGAQKAKYLREMGQLNLPYDVNWENLAQCHEGAKSWPSINYTKKALKEKDEERKIEEYAQKRDALQHLKKTKEE